MTIHFEDSELRVEPSSLAFDSSSWSVRQHVIVTPKNDWVDTGSISETVISHEVRSDDKFYERIFARNVSVTLIDDDLARVRVAHGSGNEGNVTEGGEDDHYDISLKSRPTENVVVSVYGPGLEQLYVSPSRLTFTPASGTSHNR